MRIARVFPRKTAMTPDDQLAFVDCQPPLLDPYLMTDGVDEVHVSVAFTWDIAKAEQLAEAWRVLGVPVKMGGGRRSTSRVMISFPDCTSNSETHSRAGTARIIAGSARYLSAMG